MPAQPHDQAAALKVAISASSSLAIMTAHLAWLMHREIKYIWQRLDRSWGARIFVPARYLGLSSQIFSVYFTVRMYLGVPTPPEGCRIWFSFQALVVQVLLAIVEGLLMHRLYALFKRDGAIMMILVALGGGQLASMGAHPAGAYFSTTVLTITMVLLFMTIWCYLRVPPRFVRQDLGRIVFRDSILSLCALAVIMLLLTLTSFEIIKTSVSGNIAYYWLVCVLWVSLGSIIVDHEQLPRDGDEWRATIQLTSEIEIDQSTWSEEFSQSWGTHTPSSSTLPSSPSTPAMDMTRLTSSIYTSDSEQQYLGDHSHPSVRQPILRRPRIMMKPLLTKTSRLSSSTASTSDGAQKWLDEHLRAHGDGEDKQGDQSSPSPSTALSVGESIPDTGQDGPSSASVDNSDAAQTGESDHLPGPTKVGAQQGVRSRPSQRPSGSQVRDSEESSWSWRDPP